MFSVGVDDPRGPRCELGPPRVRIFYAEPQCWYDSALAAAHTLLDSEERARSRRFVHLHDRRLYVVAHALLRYALSVVAPAREPAAWRFTAEPRFGKPRVVQPPCPLSFSLSHTPGLAACAVTLEAQLGIDVEPRDRTPPQTDGILSLGEQRQLAELHPEARSEAFFRRWTLKEAYAKALGLGLSLSFDRFGFYWRDTRVGCRDEALGADVTDHRFASWLRERHCVGLAIEGDAAHRVVETYVVPWTSTERAPAHLR